MPYTPATFVSKFAALTKPVNQIGITQTIFTPGYQTDKAVFWAKEGKGGHQKVEYYGLLIRDDIYDGIFSDRREIGMTVFVEKNDDDSASGKIYKLMRNTGTAFTDWEIVGSGSSITLTDILVAPSLQEMYNYTPLANGLFFNVTDARTTAEKADVAVLPYSRSFIFSQNYRNNNPNDLPGAFLVVHGVRDPNSHSKNTDEKLYLKLSATYLEAQTIYEHLTDSTIHQKLNDLSETGSATEVFSSQKTLLLTKARIPKPVFATGESGSPSLFLNQQGNYVAAVNTNSGWTGDMDLGGA